MTEPFLGKCMHNWNLSIVPEATFPPFHVTVEVGKHARMLQCFLVCLSVSPHAVYILEKSLGNVNSGKIPLKKAIGPALVHLSSNPPPQLTGKIDMEMDLEVEGILLQSGIFFLFLNV